ncbi:hypothetical protein JIM95_010775 [Corynebacterium sp. CCM 8835]|uniref:Glycosyltransferase RgtA/B/C/D-like domain-containing protein n=1 Tax=Corynebacterium antarcticum TaxID=2800405 RepID=A0ABS1FIK4_9CORY|nr:hypothetical protein [Corynebacterium antarcticum]MCK7643223.1 hypothetical protein [Corynebacterium antarcticum]MCK7661726.1 hypothetical protein [Corynebacterium antarcticum]MCL0246615.1 hypothetical protein [Corynebacterium antarcticum]MCX7541067.1 hypothetical protein [Corynebacterium antarcticum]
MIRRTVLTAWSVLCVGVLLWPLVGAGALIQRDMVVLPHPALSLSALGFGDLPARGAPQDGVLALAGMLVDASVLARLLLLLAGLAGAAGAAALARHVTGGDRLGPQLAAVTVTIANPFVVERLVQGHWSLVITAWLLSGIAWAALTGNLTALTAGLWAASLTPSGAVLGIAVAVACSWHRPRQVPAAAGIGLLVTLPWLVPALLGGAGTGAGGATAFAPRAEHLVGTAGALLGLGGIWNGTAVPASRSAGFAVFGVLLAVLLAAGIRRCPRPLLILAGTGFGIALGWWLLPGAATWSLAHVPGAGLLRDAQKYVVLAVPAFAALAALVADRRVLLAGAVILLAVLQVPDAPRAVGVLQPVPADPAWTRLAEVADGRDVLITDAGTIITYRGRTVVDPRSKALPLVDPGALRVDGELTDAPNPRWVRGVESWRGGDTDGVRAAGIGVVVDDGAVHDLGGSPRRDWRWWLGLGLTGSWLAVPVLTAVLRRAPAVRRTARL